MPKINLGKVVGDKGEPFTFNDFTTEQLDGITPKILKGNVTTLDPDENAIVDIRKDGINNYIDFGIPRGKNGSELKDVSSENVVMADKTTLESTMTTVNENVSANSDEINKIKSPTFNDTVSTYSTLNDANTAAETTSNAIKSKVSIFTTLSNIKKSFSAIVQGLKILGTNVGAITGITSDLAGESETVAASIKAVNALNSKLGKAGKIISSSIVQTTAARGVETIIGEITLDSGVWIILMNVWNPLGMATALLGVRETGHSTLATWQLMQNLSFATHKSKTTYHVLYTQWSEETVTVVNGEIYAIQIA